ncbi:MAG TPA: RsmE family RNA methyltransferase, partial [Paracoccaceae bacterium]|nr:RsmE family RNA methyltransferase [Paracoccaceae bacterium]
LTVPEIAPPVPFAALLGDWPRERTLVYCDEARVAPPLARVAPAPPAALLIGPEGGFAPEEAERLRAHPGTVAATLGPRILRAETAALAAIALWQAAAGDWR